MNMNRRGFFKGIGGVAAATALGGCRTDVFSCGDAKLRGDRLKFGIIGAGGKGIRCERA